MEIVDQSEPYTINPGAVLGFSMGIAPSGM
jgi:hypothetical protein